MFEPQRHADLETCQMTIQPPPLRRPEDWQIGERPGADPRPSGSSKLRGQVVYLYAFDVANEIVTAEIEDVLSLRPVKFEVRVERNYPRDVPFYRPLAIQLPPLANSLLGRPVQVLVRIYDVGAVTVALSVPFELAGLAELMPLANPKLDAGASLDAAARDICADVCRSLAGALDGPSPPTEPEAYTVFCLSDLGGQQNALDWLDQHRRDVAGVLCDSPPDNLSSPQIEETLRSQISFDTTDLVVCYWDAALVIDLAGNFEGNLYLLELANLQLVEFRVMDQILDRYLRHAYDDLERRQWSLLGVSSRVLHALRTFRVDLTKLADGVTNITKFVGDWYAARVYLAVRERFHLDGWRTNVERRLSQLDQLYSVVHSDINERRMLWLEVIIVVMFAIDLLFLVVLRR
jgi:hypothetical protein